jgi:beta-lactam-binding protein with PASTA domain
MSDTTDVKQPYGFFGLLWRMALGAVIVLGLSGAGGYYAVHRLVESPEDQAPDLLAIDLREALDKASAAGFPVIVEKREATTLLEPGRVLAQRPLPATWVKQGATIRLTVAEKP